MIEDFIKYLKNTDASYHSHTQTLEKWILEEDKSLLNGSEQPIIDRYFTEFLLEFLGYKKSECIYNEHKNGNIPDFKVEIDKEVYFCVEDKSLDIDIAPNAISKSIENQINRYLSISSTVILTNAKRILVFGRKNGQPALEIDIDIRSILKEDSLLIDDYRDTLSYFFERFSKKAVTDRLSDIREYAVNEAAWKAQALDIHDNLDSFISKSHPVLSSLKTEVSSQVYSNILRYREYKERVKEIKKDFLDGYGVYLGVIDDKKYAGNGAAQFIRTYSNDYDNLKEKLLALINEKRISSNDREAFKKIIQGLSIAASEFHYLKRQFEHTIQITESIKTWAERNKLFGEEEAAQFMAYLCLGDDDEVCRDNLRQFSAEVAYTFFMRFFIIRVIEDKEILKGKGINRVLTDGGLETWLQILEVRMKTENTFIRGKELMEEANMIAVEVFQDFEEKFSYYNWFVPRDHSIIRMIKLFGEFNFKDLRKDIIGYTWERFKVAKERHKKGQYLTPKEIVDKILDEIDYKADNKAIIGQKIIDPACGSGTFLIEAISRLREAIITEHTDEAKEIEQREKFIDKVQSDIFGFEIDSFSWYLATMNIYLSLIDDLSWLISKNRDIRIEHINLYHTDALNNYPYKDEYNIFEPAFDQDGKLKTSMEGQFAFVVGNPPYANANSEDEIVMDAVTNNPFYNGWFDGIVNIYVPFFRVAHYLLMDQGKVSFIHPITLWADDQTKATRKKMFELFCPNMLYRFYSDGKGALFEGVSQSVGITSLIKTLDCNKMDVKVGGCQSLKDLKADKEEKDIVSSSEIFKFNNIRVYPSSDIYNIENIARSFPNTLLDLLEAMGHDRDEITGEFSQNSGKVQRYYQGTVNATYIWSKHNLHIPIIDEYKYNDKMPLYKADSAFYLSPLPKVPVKNQKTKDNTEFRYVKVPDIPLDKQKEVHKKLLRIWNMDKDFWYVAHPEIGNASLYRRIKPVVGIWNKTNKAVFPHTLYVFEAKDKCSALTISALFISSLFQMIYGIDNTNVHLNKGAILSLPVPSLSAPKKLVGVVEDAYAIAGKYLKILENYNVTNRSSSGIVDILNNRWTDVDEKKIIKIFDFETWLNYTVGSTQSLQDYIDANLVETNRTIRKTGEKRYEKATYLVSNDDNISIMIEWINIFYGTKEISPLSIVVPAVPQIKVQIQKYKNFLSDMEDIGIQFAAKIIEIDNIVIDWYGMSKYRNTISNSLPWVK